MLCHDYIFESQVRISVQSESRLEVYTVLAPALLRIMGDPLEYLFYWVGELLTFSHPPPIRATLKNRKVWWGAIVCRSRFIFYAALKVWAVRVKVLLGSPFSSNCFRLHVPKPHIFRAQFSLLLCFRTSPWGLPQTKAFSVDTWSP